MLPGIAGIAGAASASPTLLQTLTSLGLTTNLKLCLDAGDALSYTSGQSWLDRSGGGYDFLLGSSAASSSDDPTFHGTPGGQSSNEYWAFDGALDKFRYDSANETWMQALHKDSAILSAAFWVYLTSGQTMQVFGTNDGDTGIGCLLYVDPSSNIPKWLVSTTAAATVFENTTATALTGSRWNFVGLRVDEPANTMSFVVNGTVTTQACTYSSPSASPAVALMEIAASGPSSSTAGSGNRLNSLMISQGTALTTADLTSLYNATRSIFGV